MRTKPPALSAAYRTWRFRPSSDVSVETVGNELLLVHLVEGTTFRLNRTAKAIWELARESLPPSEIVQRMQAGFGISLEQSSKDVAALLQELVQNGLLEVLPEPTP